MKVAVLGDGVTGKSVKAAIPKIPDCELVAPEQAELIISSPGIPPSQTDQYSAPVISDIEFAYRVFQTHPTITPPKLIAITGTNGKTTTTEMVAAALNCPVAGNIGVPLIDYYGQDIPWIALELSSYQLYRCQEFRAEISIITQLSSDHLDWHGSLDNYHAAKFNLWQALRPSDHIIYDAADPIVSDYAKSVAAIQHPIHDADIKTEMQKHPRFFGRHQYINLAMAKTAAAQSDVSSSDDWPEHFELAEHRMERFDVAGRLCVNDSKSTNWHATEAALAAASDYPSTLMLGVEDKMIPIPDTFRDLPTHVRRVIAFGESRGRVIEALEQNAIPVLEAETLEAACRLAVDETAPDEWILFSPANPSFDEFKNYQERGRVFKQTMLRLLEEA